MRSLLRRISWTRLVNATNWFRMRFECLPYRRYELCFALKTLTLTKMLFLNLLKCAKHESEKIFISILFVSQSVAKLAISSGQYLRIYLSYFIEIWHSLQDRLHNYMSIISALYLSWVLSCRGVESGSKWFM